MATLGGRLSRSTRVGLVVGALGLLGLLGIAGWLRPDRRGYGTHMQLGLPRCAFFALTGQRCPSCGMTTAFAWCVRGRLDRAWEANPAGSLLAPACAALIPWLLGSAVQGRPWGTRTIDGPLIVLVVAAVALGLGAWMIRLLFGLGGC
ncbi:MAG: DUF2752 domain-containing protein [Isosphaeraceae bacterium]|nr:DUF2752 domain-containing protein [Isosphaeraceae bacterium]